MLLYPNLYGLYYSCELADGLDKPSVCVGFFDSDAETGTLWTCCTRRRSLGHNHSELMHSLYAFAGTSLAPGHRFPGHEGWEIVVVV